MKTQTATALGEKSSWDKLFWVISVEKWLKLFILIPYIYIALFWALKALYILKGESPQPPPVCSIHLDDATAAILRQNAHHTPILCICDND